MIKYKKYNNVIQSMFKKSEENFAKLVNLLADSTSMSLDFDKSNVRIDLFHT